MIHPSYTDLMQVINSGVEEGNEPLVSSRYSVVLATAKRARQIIDGAKPSVEISCSKPLSIAVQEVYENKVKILPEDAVLEDMSVEEIEDGIADAADFVDDVIGEEVEEIEVVAEEVEE